MSFHPLRLWSVAPLFLVLGMIGCGTSAPPASGPTPMPVDQRIGRTGDDVNAPARLTTGSAAEPAAAAEARLEPGNAALAYPTGNRQTSTLLVEKLGPPEVRLGRSYDYQIRVTNLVASPLLDVTVREEVPNGLAVARAEPAPRVEGAIHSYALGELAPRESKVINVSATAREEGKIGSCITVAYTPVLCTTVLVVNPQLKIVKEAVAQADICEPIAYKYVVTNIGTGTERNVRIEEMLPEGLVTAETKQSNVIIDLGDLPAGRSKEATARLSASRPGEYAGVATVRGAGSEAQSERVAVVVRQPLLGVNVKGPATEYVQKQATYQVVVENTGDAPARNVVVRLDTAGRGEITGLTPGEGTALGESRVAGGGIDLGTIEPGKSKSFDAVFRALREGEMRVAARATAQCAAPAEASVATEVLTLPALRLEVVDVEDAIRTGTNVVYRIGVKNQGTGDDEDVSIVATLPEGLQFVRSDGATAGKVDGRTVTFEPLPSLAPGKSAEWTVEAKALDAGDVRFEVQLRSKSLTKPAVETEPTRLY